MKARTHRLRRPFLLPYGHIIPISGLPCPAGGRSIAPLLVVLPSPKTRNIDPVVLAPLFGIGGRCTPSASPPAFDVRQRDVLGKSVVLNVHTGGTRIIKKKIEYNSNQTKFNIARQ